LSLRGLHAPQLRKRVGSDASILLPNLPVISSGLLVIHQLTTTEFPEAEFGSGLATRTTSLAECSLNQDLCRQFSFPVVVLDTSFRH